MKEKLYRFMQGRYGMDQLNRFLMFTVIVLLLLLSIFDAGILYPVAILLFIYTYYRMFSKNLIKRRAENALYLQYESKVKQFFFRKKQAMAQQKTHHIYKCPSCSQKIRIPRGKGKIEIRCPKCGHTFIKRS